MDKLNMLLARCKCGVFLTVNEHRDYYESAAHRLDDYYGSMKCPVDVPADMRQRMIETDTIIDLQFYPATPIGSYQILDCDLDSALNRALACLDIEAK